MKKLAMTSAVAFAIAISANSAIAADFAPEPSNSNFYLTVFGGAAFFDDFFTDGGQDYNVGFDTGFVAGGAIGVSGLFIENVRTEIEVSYMEADVNDYESVDGSFVGVNPRGHISSINVLGNLWYDFALGSAFQPYVGGGVGVGFADTSVTVDNGAGFQFSGDDVGFAFQAGGGVRWALSEMILLDVGYRFRGVTDVLLDDAGGLAPLTSEDIFVHTVQGGLTIQLP